jgi:hypothetical protein
VSLILRLMFVITVVVAVTDLAVYYHLRQHPEHLTLLGVGGVVVITLVPIGINILYWHRRGWL